MNNLTTQVIQGTIQTTYLPHAVRYGTTVLTALYVPTRVEDG